MTFFHLLSAGQRGLLDGKAHVGFAEQNQFDRKPPRDDTWDVYPFSSLLNYSAVGREVFVEICTRF